MGHIREIKDHYNKFFKPKTGVSLTDFREGKGRTDLKFRDVLQSWSMTK